MPHQHLVRRTTAALAAVTAVLALPACGSGGSAGAPVTVTVTPTVTAGSATRTRSSTPAAAKAPRSDVVGRRFDFGTIAEVRKQGSTTVLELDRWTWRGVADAKLAAGGVPPGPFKGKVPYTNQNTETTFTIPVVDGARVLHHHCVAFDQPLQTRSATVQELADLGEREDTVLVELDEKGRLTSAQNIPGCPG